MYAETITYRPVRVVKEYFHHDRTDQQVPDNLSERGKGERTAHSVN